MVDNIAQDVAEINLSTVVSKVKMVGSKESGGLTLGLRGMYALTEECSQLLSQFKMENRCSWGTRLHR